MSMDFHQTSVCIYIVEIWSGIVMGKLSIIDSYLPATGP